MFRPRVIPVLLLKGNGIVKTVKFKHEKYIGDPINAVHIFNSLEIDELILLDIGASKEGRTISIEMVKNIGDEAYMPLTVGGGIRNTKDAVALINVGAEKVLINSAFAINHRLASELAGEIGSQSLVISIDVKKDWRGNYIACINNGRDKVMNTPKEMALRAEESGAGEIIINSISNDGTMIGYDLELIELISSSVSIPVIACGGAGNLLHLKQAVDKGAHAVAAGSIFVYHGARKGVLINYPERSVLNKIFI